MVRPDAWCSELTPARRAASSQPKSGRTSASFRKLTDEPGFEIRQPNLIGPLLAADRNRVAAMMVRAIDQETTQAEARISPKVILCGRVNNDPVVGLVRPLFPTASADHARGLVGAQFRSVRAHRPPDGQVGQVGCWRVRDARNWVVGQFDCGRVPGWKTDGSWRIFGGWRQLFNAIAAPSTDALKRSSWYRIRVTRSARCAGLRWNRGRKAPTFPHTNLLNVQTESRND
jgi:hypothetical protein